MRRVLIVSYWFPPAVGAASERIYGLARHLPAYGWDVDVLTAERSGTIPAIDCTRIHAVPDPLASEKPIFGDYDPRAQITRPTWPFRQWSRELVFPDRFLLWRRRAVAVGRQLLAEQPFDCILTSFPPASAVSAAIRLHRLARIPLVLDMRDLWIGPGGYSPRSPWGRGLHARLRAVALGEAAQIVTVSDAMARGLVDEDTISPARVSVVMNGFEEEPSDPPPACAGSRVTIPLPREDGGGSSEPVAPPTSGSPVPDSVPFFTIAHVGTVIGRNRPDLLFKTLAELHRAGRLFPLRFRFVGNLSAAYIDSLGLAELLETTGLVSKALARKEMAAADALLLLTGDYVGRWGYNAKLFEYVRARRPILCLEEREGSNDAAFLRCHAADRSFVARLGDADSLLRELTALRRHLIDSPRTYAADDAFKDFSRRNLAGRMAKALESAVARPR